MKSILFNTEMVRAILDGRKTVTRRVVKPQPVCHGPSIAYPPHESNLYFDKQFGWIRCRVCGNSPQYSYENSEKCHFWVPPYRPGDILYVRETWTVWDGNYEYKADVDDGYGPFCSSCTLDICAGGCNSVLKWRPSIHMPREAARLFLRVTDVRVERLQDCGNMQAKDEGCTCCSQFARIWDSTIKPKDRALYGWEANPWVWVVEFERISREEAVQ